MGSAAAKRRVLAGWRLIAALVLLAFTIQSYVAQTHFHDTAVGTAPVSQNVGHGKVPVDDNPLTCPFCQAVAHAGSFYLPMAPALFLSVQWVEMSAPHFLLHDSSGAAAHSWQSRAPPIH